jgi:signal transduction histidine kinase
MTERREADVPRGGIGLSTKLLGLTVLFVLLAEVLIYVPSVANFRLNWLRDRLAAAQTAALVFEASPDGMIPRELESEMLRHVGALTISLKQGGRRRLLSDGGSPPMIQASFDLRQAPAMDAVGDAIATLFAGNGRIVRVIGSHPRGGDFVEIVMDETPLREAMVAFSRNILLLSLVISAITAALVFLALNRLFVRPMRRLHANMVTFREAPEDATRVITPSARRDELGRAEVELARLQREVQGALQQKSHLANLGLAVAKINHDLRNILASAQLFSDRLAAVPDPTVQRLLPKVLAALDRAIALCRDTLAYGRAVEPAPARRRFPLRPLVDEVGAGLALGPDTRIVWSNRVEAGLEIDADPDQLFRVLLNLGRNAQQAIDGADGRITLSARREGAVTVIEMADTGPGVPAKVRAELFRPFHASSRRGGSGLGLAIADELVKGHGGSITLADGTLGATFLIAFPDAPIDLAERRAERVRA